MFSTLRHGFGEGKPFVSVETIPPFGKDQQPLRLSCEACRAKKTKCVKGANGCMRCVSQKRKCEYQTRSNFGSGATASRARSNSSTSPAPASIISTAREDSGENSSSANKKVQKRRRFQGQPKQKSWSSSSSQVTTIASSPDRSGGVLVTGGEEEEEDTEFDTAFLAGSGGEMQEFLEMHFFSGASTSSPEPMAVDDTASAAATATGATSIAELQAGQPQGGGKVEQQEEVSAAAAEAAAPSESLIPAVDEVNFLAFDDTALDLSWSPPKDNHLAPPAGPCFCMSTAVGIYETIQVELIWNSQDDVSVGRQTSSAEDPRASSSSSSPPLSSSSSSPSSAQARLPPAMILSEQTILQRQKTALAQFESLFWCDSCWTRSDYVMLIITMCDLILTSLEAVVELLGRGPREASDAIARLEMEAGSWLSAAEPATAEVDDPADGLFKNHSSSSSSSSSLPSLSLSCSPFAFVGAADGVGFREGSSAGGGQRQQQQQQQQQQQSGLRIGTWQLDDDDEMVVVTGLLKVRMVRLSNLITKAEGVVGANGWPVHERMTQALRRRFDKIMVLLSFGGHFVAI